jgi:hypothetical protein
MGWSNKICPVLYEPSSTSTSVHILVHLQPVWFERDAEERKRDERKREEMPYFHCLEQQRNSRERPKLCGSHVCSSSLLNGEEMQKGSSLFLFFQFYPSFFASSNVCAKWLGS